MYRTGRRYDDVVSAISMPEFDACGKEYYRKPNDDFDEEQPPRRNPLPSMEESSSEMQFSVVDEMEEEEQYSGQNSEPEWKSARRLSHSSQHNDQFRDSSRFRESQKSSLRKSNLSNFRDSNQFRQSNMSNFRESKQLRQSDLSNFRESNQFRESQLMRQSTRDNSEVPQMTRNSQQLRSSQISTSEGNRMSLRESAGPAMQRRESNKSRNQSIRQSNTSLMSGQSLRNSQFNNKEDEVSDMTSTVNESARATRSSANDSSTLDTVTLQSVEGRRPSVTTSSTEYHLPAAKGIDFCADTDPLNTIPLDAAPMDQDLSKQKRKKMWYGLIVLIFLLGGIGVSALFVTGVISLRGMISRKENSTTLDEDKSAMNTNTMTLEELGSITARPTKSISPSPAPSITPFEMEVIDILDIPPDDLEGRCSPSNFPFAIEICRDSCSIAECCYLNEDAVVKGCFDTSVDTYSGRLNAHRCTLYRPYCDVFFDPWNGGEEGYIRPPPSNMNQLCRKRLKARVNLPGRALDFEDDVCFQNCLPSKCCQAMKVAGESDIESIITYFLPRYVMTNCERLNKEVCDAYNTTCFGIFDEPTPLDPVSFSSASPSVAASLAPSESIFVSLSPTLVPTLTLTSNPSAQPVEITTEPTDMPSNSPSLSITTQPTRVPTIPIANTLEINDICTSPTSKNLIVGGNSAARRECLRVCQPGICCYADIFVTTGLTDIAGNPANIQSCFDNNREVCEGYSGCLTLTLPRQHLQPLPGVPEVPTQDLSMLCSEESRADPTGVLECFKQCRKGSCCNALPSESCFGEYEDICGLYGPCQAMLDAYGGDESGLPPKPPTNLNALCSYDYLLDEKRKGVTSECESACASIECCLEDECPDNEVILRQHDEGNDNALSICDLYSPCQNLYEGDRMQACLGGASSKSVECQSVCDVASCCFPQPGEESCFSLFEGLCILYAPFCAPPHEAEGLSWKKVPPPPKNLLTLCITGYGGDNACKEACAPSDCCFTTAQSCFAENEETCAQWEICAAGIQSQEEQDVGFEDEERTL